MVMEMPKFCQLFIIQDISTQDGVWEALLFIIYDYYNIILTSDAQPPVKHYV